MEEAVEAGEQFGGAAVGFSEGAHGSDEEGDGHGGFESLAADVAEDDEGGGLIGVAVVGDEDLVDAAGGGHLLLDLAIAGLDAAEAEGHGDEHDDGEEEIREPTDIDVVPMPEHVLIGTGKPKLLGHAGGVFDGDKQDRSADPAHLRQLAAKAGGQHQQLRQRGKQNGNGRSVDTPPIDGGWHGQPQGKIGVGQSEHLNDSEQHGNRAVEETEDKLNEEQGHEGVGRHIDSGLEPHRQLGMHDGRDLDDAEGGDRAQAQGDPEVLPQARIDGVQQQEDEAGEADGCEAELVGGVDSEVAHCLRVGSCLHLIGGHHHIRNRRVENPRAPLRKRPDGQHQAAIGSQGAGEFEEAGAVFRLKEFGPAASTDQAPVGIHLEGDEFIVCEQAQLGCFPEVFRQGDLNALPGDGVAVERRRCFGEPGACRIVDGGATHVVAVVELPLGGRDARRAGILCAGGQGNGEEEGRCVEEDAGGFHGNRGSLDHFG